MRCEYCGQEHNSQLMTQDTVDATIAYLKRSLANGNYSNLFVRWFGGEPLIAYDQILEISDRVSNYVQNSAYPSNPKCRRTAPSSQSSALLNFKTERIQGD